MYLFISQSALIKIVSPPLTIFPSKISRPFRLWILLPLAIVSANENFGKAKKIDRQLVVLHLWKMGVIL